MAYVTFGIFYVPLLESKIYMNKKRNFRKKLTSFCRCVKQNVNDTICQTRSNERKISRSFLHTFIPSTFFTAYPNHHPKRLHRYGLGRGASPSLFPRGCRCQPAPLALASGVPVLGARSERASNRG